MARAKTVILCILAFLSWGLSGCSLQQPVDSSGAHVLGGGASHNSAVVQLISASQGAYACGGSLIDPWYVLTAGNCLSHYVLDPQLPVEERFRVVAGAFKLINKPQDVAGAGGVWRDVASVQKLGNGRGNDLALLRLSEPIYGVTPLVLRLESPPTRGETLTTIGWGGQDARDGEVLLRPIQESRQITVLSAGPSEPYAYSGIGWLCAMPDLTSEEKQRCEQDRQFCSQAASSNPCQGLDGTQAVLCQDHVDSCRRGYDTLLIPRTGEFYTTEGACYGDNGTPALDAQGRVVGIASRVGRVEGLCGDDRAALQQGIYSYTSVADNATFFETLWCNGDPERVLLRNDTSACGQEANGTLLLSAQAVCASAVEFSANGRSLVVTTARPYRLEWNSDTAAPGLVSIAVRALDGAGKPVREQVCQIALANQGRSPLLSENFEAGAVAFTATGLGQLLSTDACPTLKAANPTSSKVWQFGRPGRCDSRGPQFGQPAEGELVSPFFAASASSHVSFRQFRDMLMSSDFQTRVEVNLQGEPDWSMLWFQDASSTDGRWERSPDLSLSAYAGKSIRLRFRFSSLSGGSAAKLGWVIDELRVSP